MNLIMTADPTNTAIVRVVDSSLHQEHALNPGFSKSVPGASDSLLTVYSNASEQRLTLSTKDRQWTLTTAEISSAPTPGKPIEVPCDGRCDPLGCRGHDVLHFKDCPDAAGDASDLLDALFAEVERLRGEQ